MPPATTTTHTDEHRERLHLLCDPLSAASFPPHHPWIPSLPSSSSSYKHHPTFLGHNPITSSPLPTKQKMDPCGFVRVLVGNLALRIPVAPRPARSGVHPSSTPCFCRIGLGDLPQQTSPIPLSSPDQSLPVAASFDLCPSDLDRLRRRSRKRITTTTLKVSIYTGRRGTTCGLSSARLLGKVSVPVELDRALEGGRSCTFHNGWVPVGEAGKGEVHLTVRSEPDPRFVFEFDGEPECSPQVFQVQGSMRQPVFTCNFSCRNPSIDRSSHRSMSMQSEPNSSRSWLSAFGSDRERHCKERKGWSVMVHDLSGSPVALASVVTPFVPSPGSNRVSRSNPGAWLVLLPGDGTWKPWGRLEAWRERGGSTDGLGYRFDLLPDTNMSSAGVLLAESTVSTRKGGRFAVDLTVGGGSSGGSGRTGSRSGTPGCSPRGSGDYGHALGGYRGFVMSSTVGAEGRCSKPCVEIGFQNVGCTEDAAAFVALAAAVDLSMDACRLFSSKLKKELCQQQQQELLV